MYRSTATSGEVTTEASTHAVRPEVTETIKRRALTALLKQIIANNRAGGWRKLKAQ